MSSKQDGTASGNVAPAPVGPAINQATNPATAEAAPMTSQKPAQVLEGIPSKIARPAEDAPTPILPVGAQITYVCESGMPLRIAFAGALAYVDWTGGAKLTLSMGDAGVGGGEMYAGDGYTLRRLANVVELSAKAGGEFWRCAEGAASA
ncbi:MAG: hypothetical protein ABIQ62_06430 [Thermomonas sp.]